MLEQIYLLLLRLLAPHACFYVREMRILAYAGLLQSYSSLVLDSLAHAFGTTVDFVDKCVTCNVFLAFFSELMDHRCSESSRFIASGQLHATTDRVHGIVETNHPAFKDAQTETEIHKGDVFLSSIQQLSKVLY
jgi:26S proteasome regulatory subunit N7